MPTLIISDNSTGSTHAGVEDTWLLQSAPTTNNGTSGTLQVQANTASERSTSLFRFALPAALNGATVSDVRLKLWQTDGGSASAWPLDLYEMLRPFVETEATWNKWAAGSGATNDWATGGGVGTGDAGATLLATINPDTGGGGVLRTLSGSGLTAHLQALATANASQVSLILRPRNLAATSDPYVVFRSSEGTDGQRPTLEIDYTAAGDTTPPNITSPTGTGGALTCSGGVTTDEGNGTLYAVVTASATAPTKAQVKAGQDHTGSAALRVSSQAISSTGAKTIGSGSVTAGTRYWHYMHEDSSGNQSNVVSSASFPVTAAAPTINTQPSNQTANEPATATFTVSATASGGSLTYQWQRAAPGSGTFSNVSTGTGGTSASYTTAATSASADHGAQYRCNVTDSNGTTATTAATLTVRSTTTTARPSADVSAGGWTPSTGAVLWDMIDEASASDADFITSPSITATPAPAVMALPYPVNTGTWNIGIRARCTGSSATMRVKLLDGSGTVVGTSADQVITGTATTYTLPITISAPAFRASVEVVS